MILMKIYKENKFMINKENYEMKIDNRNNNLKKIKII